MFKQTFKNIDDILHKDAGCGSELDDIEVANKTYTNIITPEHQYSNWVAPKKMNKGSNTLNNRYFEEMKALDKESAAILEAIKSLI